MANEYDFFQFNPGSIGDGWVGDVGRSPDSKISNYEDYKNGTARSDDYTRVTFANAIEENPSVAPGIGYGTDWAYYVYNPYVWGSTVLKTLDDKMTRMNMGSLNLKNMGFSDKKAVDASGMSQYKNYPSEGWRSFGGKYDFEKAYQG